MVHWRTLGIAGASATLSCTLLAPAGAQNPDSVQIRAEKLTEGTYVLFGRGGNIGLSVGAEAVFVVDDQFAPLTPKVLAAIASITDRPVRFVLNTHWHFDHTGGNENMGKAGALIVAHDNVRRRMSTKQFIEFIKREEPAAAPGALPVVTFNDAVTFHINGDEVAVFHLPRAHTDGDAVVHFRRTNIVHMGDVYVTGSFPFVDLSSGGSVSGIIGGVERVLALINDDTKVIPGHGPMSNKAALGAYHAMMVTVRDRVRVEAAKGRTLEQILASKPAAEFEQFGRGFIKADDFVRFAHAETSRR